MPLEQPSVTVLLPALNEEGTIAAVIERVLALPVDLELIVIDDGSTDATPEILGSFEDRIQILRNETRGGKGNAIRKALPYAKGKVVIIQDADLEYFPEEIPKLVEPILAGRANVVFGTRFSEGLPRGMALPNKVVNVLLAFTVRVLFGTRLSDEATCYKAVRADLMRRMDLQCQRFEFCPEVTAKSLRLGEKILEVPVSYEPRTKEAGKKIRWTDAPDAFWTLLKYRFKSLNKPQ
ncbi:MAG TPA: glycosyltransferase family 2 protein [Fimbriimonas sp.]|nr:glycosyltransferase family 2 protein [Fimbriimonas sp.]